MEEQKLSMAKLSFPNKGEIKTFSDIEKLEEYITSRLELHYKKG